MSDLLNAVRRSIKKEDLDAVESAEELIVEQEGRIAAASQEVAEAAERLRRVRSGALIYEFLTERIGHEDYVGSMGIVTVLRRDLEHLQRSLFELWSQGEQASQAAAGVVSEAGKSQKPEQDVEKDVEQAAEEGKIPQRIILYVDDLDRCEPQRVVEVLQAVHLLLAFKLFAVVVAVDPRWLERALYERYVPDHGRMSHEELAADEFSPQNYLEKIFQVPFRVPVMEPKAFQSLVDSLAPRETLDDDDEGEPPELKPKNGYGGTAPSGSGGAGGDEPVPQTEASLSSRPTSPPLQLQEHEVDALSSVGAFIKTPRATKRLVNVYTLIRNLTAERAPELHGKLVSPEDDAAHALVLLLAMDIGFPHASLSIRAAFDDDHDDLLSLVASIKKRSTASPTVVGSQLGKLAQAIEESVSAHAIGSKELAPWRRYADLFSFHDPETRAVDVVS